MTNTEKEATGYVTVVEKVENSSMAQIAASNERISQMDKLNRKLRSKKTMITKSIKKVETTTDSFQEVGAEGATVTLIKMEAEEVLTSVEKLKEHQKDLETISSSLQDAINECESNELKRFTPVEAMNNLEKEVDEYLERINMILGSKKRVIAKAKEKVFKLLQQQ